LPAKLNIKFPPIISSNLYLLVLAAWFITLSFIIDNYWSANSSTKTVVSKLNKYVKDNEQDFFATVTNPNNFNIFSKDSTPGSFLEEIQHKSYFLFSYALPQDSAALPRFWSSQLILPGQGIYNSSEQSGFAQLVNGLYVWNKYDTAGLRFVSLLPVKWNFFVTNDYLKNTFANNISISDNFDIFPGKSQTANVTTFAGQALFYVKKKPGTYSSTSTLFSIALRVLASLLILLFIHLYATYLAVRKRFLTGLFFLVSVLLILRLLSYQFPIPFDMKGMALFSPSIYKSTFLFQSLGDLFINTGLITWIVLFIQYHVHEKKITLQLNGNRQKWLALGIFCFLTVAATFIASAIIRSLIANSKISFDVINFFSLNVYTVIGFLILCLVSIAFYFLCQVLLVLIRPYFNESFREIYIGICVAGLLLLSFRIGNLSGGFAIYSLLWLLLFIFLLSTKYLDLLASRLVSSKLVFWVFFFSLSITFIIIFENNKKELQNRYQYADVLAAKRNATNETILSAMLKDFRMNFLLNNFHRLADSTSNKHLKDSLISNNFSGYLNRFDTKIYSFDRNNNPLYNNGRLGYNQLNTILITQARPTSIKGLYYYDESFDRFNYISKKSVVDTSGKTVGSLFIIVTPKNVKNEMIYPELFGKGKESAIENSSLYSFAIYSNGKLVSSHNDYPFATTMPPVDFLGKEWVSIKSYKHDQLWYNAGGNTVIVIVKENRFFIEFITLFSYLFCAFLLLAAFVWLITVFIGSRLNPRKLKVYWQLSIRNQIHGVIIFISVLSFLIIGTATILFFINRYESNNREKLSRVIQIMKSQMSNSIQGGWVLSDTMNVSDSSSKTAMLAKSFFNIADIHGVDVNVYDLKGSLKFSSLPLPYNEGILSTRMEPMAYLHLNKQKEVQYFQKEHIGNLKYLSSYVPLNDADGNSFAYLNIPYFTSETNLQQEIANFLVTIINLNAFIFLIAGIVALFIATRITHSFSVIGDKMKKINLGTHNEAIEWNRKDEIGSLVDEYNKMVSKLDASAAALAKTEREGAWREMAKQVAHEIKNPLTPMKLSLQFLQRSIENNSPDVNILTTKVSHTLVEQIDHLSKIASDFSQFANIEKADKVFFDINEQLVSVKGLYDTDANVDIDWKLADMPVWIFGDKTHINRLFTNLILNAIQAVPDGRKPEIKVEEIVRPDHVLIQVKDNGDGIPENAQSKIFMPNFTTKSSGTGLGLAMSKRIVEQVHGSIWFETLQGDGTSFFISIPLAKEP